MNQNKTVDIEVIDESATINIDVPAGLYAHINKFIIDSMPQDPEKLKDLLTRINDKEVDDADHEYFKFKVLFGLTYIIEEAARKQGAIKKTTLDMETGEQVNTEKNPQDPQSQSTPE